HLVVAAQVTVSTSDGTIAKNSRMMNNRPRNLIRFTETPGAERRCEIRSNIPCVRVTSHESRVAHSMKTHTSYLTFNTKRRQEIIDITDEVEKCRAAAGLAEG